MHPFLIWKAQIINHCFSKSLNKIWFWNKEPVFYLLCKKNCNLQKKWTRKILQWWIKKKMMNKKNKNLIQLNYPFVSSNYFDLLFLRHKLIKKIIKLFLLKLNVLFHENNSCKNKINWKGILPKSFKSSFKAKK